MRIREDFTRCSCGNAHLKKEEFILASYNRQAAKVATDFNELRKEIRYTCEKCNEIIHIQRE